MPKYILGQRARTRSAMLRYTLLVGALLLVLSVLQVSLFSRFRLFGAVPDLMLCTVLVLAFFCGRYTGAITGMAAGFLIEAIGAHGISLLPLFYLLLGYVTGHYARAVTPKSFLTYLPYLSVGLAVRSAITLLYASMTYQSLDIPRLLVSVLLPELAVTAAAGCAFYFPLLLFCRIFNKQK